MISSEDTTEERANPPVVSNRRSARIATTMGRPPSSSQQPEEPVIPVQEQPQDWTIVLMGFQKSLNDISATLERQGAQIAKLEREKEEARSAPQHTGNRSTAILPNPRNPVNEIQHIRHSSYHPPTRMSKVEFPKFSGENVRGWLLQCEQFFVLDETPEWSKVRMASIHLQATALQWYRGYVSNRGDAEPSWQEFKMDVEARFSMALFRDPMAELAKLKQTGSIQDYQDKFDELVAEVNLLEQQKLSCFLSGLRRDYEMEVRKFQPTSVKHALILARLHEQIQPNSMPTRVAQKYTTPSSNAVTPVVHYRESVVASEFTNDVDNVLAKGNVSEANNSKKTRVVTNYYLEDRRAKGLCFYCPEKYHRDHVCKKKKRLYMLQVMDDEDDCEEQEAPALEQEGAAVETPIISLNALYGVPSCRTMKVQGVVKTQSIQMLLDSGSTHNFIDNDLARKLGYNIVQTNLMQVEVANGESVTSSGICKGLQWNIEDIKFSADVLTLPLGGCDMVLGVQWLSTLGPVLWDFQNLWMKFVHEGSIATIKEKLVERKIISIDDQQLMKLLLNQSKTHKDKQAFGMPLCCTANPIPSLFSIELRKLQQMPELLELHATLKGYEEVIAKHQEVDITNTILDLSGRILQKSCADLFKHFNIQLLYRLYLQQGSLNSLQQLPSLNTQPGNHRSLNSGDVMRWQRLDTYYFWEVYMKKLMFHEASITTPCLHKQQLTKCYQDVCGMLAAIRSSRVFNSFMKLVKVIRMSLHHYIGVILASATRVKAGGYIAAKDIIEAGNGSSFLSPSAISKYEP